MVKTARKGSRRANANARRANWNNAIAEGRVVRALDGAVFHTFATAAEAVARVAEYHAAGLDAVIVDPSLAE